MLRDVYLQVGLGWTVLIGGLAMLTVLTWLVAIAGAVTRPMTPLRRAFLLGVLTFIPPSAILVLLRFVAVTRGEYRLRTTSVADSGSGPVSDLALVAPGRRAA